MAELRNVVAESDQTVAMPWNISGPRSKAKLVCMGSIVAISLTAPVGGWGAVELQAVGIGISITAASADGTGVFTALRFGSLVRRRKGVQMQDAFALVQRTQAPPEAALVQRSFWSWHRSQADLTIGCGIVPAGGDVVKMDCYPDLLLRKVLLRAEWQLKGLNLAR